ncbi:MAG: diaminopimelate epimerase [Bacteroidia bacterium]|nr:diaminopimelate epimerase [Bacteroidia bacterium]
MGLHFYKYQGTGNDFIIFDDRIYFFDQLKAERIRFLCDRRYGIGADGLILLQNSHKYDFKMVYYNSDGIIGSMCGNGGRCITLFANRLGLIEKTTKFETVDGVYEAQIDNHNMVRLLMQDVSIVDKEEDYFYLNTGSPHYVKFVPEAKSTDVVAEGRKIRYSEQFREKGINVNFVQAAGERLFVCTYERGVEDETLSCGTGVVAAAICAAYDREPGDCYYDIITKGGNMVVYFTKENKNSYKNIWLKGPAELAFEGDIEITV